MIDFIAYILRVPGGALRHLLELIPLPLAKSLFVLYPIVLFIWVLRMKPSDVRGTVQGRRKEIDLRPYAGAALLMQAAIYLYFW